MEENQNLVELYNALHKKGVTAASNVSEFKMLLDDEKNRQDMYDALNKKGVFSGTYDEFQTSIGYELNQQPAPARVDVSDVEDETIVRTEQPENYVEMPKQDARQSKYPLPSYYPQYRNDDANPSVEQKVKDDGFVVPSELTEENFKSVKQRRDELNKRLEEIGESAQHLGQMGFMAPKEPLNALSEEAKKIRSELETIDGFIDSWNNTDESRAYLERQKQRVNDVSSSIDKAQEENNRNRINRQIERDSKLTFFGRLAKSLQATENPITPEVVEALTDPTTNGLRAAKNEVRNADKQLQLEDMRRNGEMKGLAFIRGLETANYYELIPAIGMADAFAILDAKQALEEGRELNQSQQLLLEAMEARAEVDNAYQDNNTIWERVGRSTPEQLMFTAQFVVGAGVTGATKVGERVAAKSAERAAVKYAKKGVKSSARRFIGGNVLPKLEGMAVSSAMQTFANPLGVAGMVEDFERRYAGDIYYDNEGNLHVFDNDRGAGKAAYQAIASAWIENFTEYAGENITKSAKLLDSKMFDIAGKFDNVIKRVGAGKIADVFSIPKQLGQITQIGSAPEEFLEEELGSVMNALFATDAESGESYGDSFKRTIGQSFSGEQQLETLLSCAITSMLLGGGGNAVNAVGNAGRRKQANRDVEQSKALLGKVKGISINELDNQIENGQIKDIASYLKQQSDANGWSQDEQGAAVSYVMNRTRQIGIKHNDDIAIEEAQQEMRQQAEDMANRWDGNIYNATWKDNEGNEQPVTIINGRIHYNTRENGTIHFDPYTSSGMIAIRLSDGTKKQVPSRTITGIQSVMSVDEQLEAQGNTIPQMMQAQFEQEGMAIPTVESVWGGNLVANETQFENGKYTYLGQDQNGLYAFANNDKKTQKDNPIVYMTERQLVEYGLSLNIQAANAAGDAETARQAQDDLDFMQHLDELTAEATEKDQWDVLKAYASQYVGYDENGSITPESNPKAYAPYLLASSEGSFENAIASIDESIAAWASEVQQQSQAADISGDAAMNAETHANMDRVDGKAAGMVDFYTNVRNILLEMQQGQQEAIEESLNEMPVSQMEVGQEFPVMYDGQQAVAVVVGKDADGRNVLTIRDQDGNDLESGIDDWEDEQWDAVRVKAEDSSVAEEPEPVGKGSFGYIYDQFRGKAKEAVEFLIKKKSGEAIGALSHRSVGEIDIVWGDEGTGKSDGFGLAKLVKYHPEVIGNLQELLDDMEVVSRSENRVNLESKTHKAGVRLDWDGVRKTWLMTMFEKKGASEPANGTTDITGNQSGLENDTAPFQNPDVSAGKDNANSDTTGGNGVKNSIPRDKDGNIAHASLDRNDAETYAAAVGEEADNAEAFAGMGDTGYISRNLDAAGKEVDKAEKRKPKATNASRLREELAEINMQRQSAKDAVAFWQAVDAELKRRQAVRLAERQAADDERHARALAEEEERKAEDARKKAEQEQLGANNVSDNIREKWNNSTKIEGNADEITLANGERIEGHYYLVESGSASASHDATEGFKKTEGFPVDENGQTVNDRDYEGDKNAQQITRTMAQNYDSRAAQEAPVVSQDGVVMSGNGRTMAGELAALNNTDGAYIEYLNKYPHKYGFTTEQVGGMSHPRVVFVPNERMPYTTDTFAKFNQQGMKGQSKTEQAVKLGKIVDDATFGRIIRSINRFDTLGDFYADSNATAEAIGELQKAGAINQMQHTEMFDGETISETGKQMLENMLIGKAFESNPDAVRQLAAYKSLRQSVITALAEISNNIALGEYSLESELSQAIELAYNARSKGYKAGDKVSEFAVQTVLFAEDGATAADFTNATVMMLADLLNDNRVTRLKKALQVYNNQAVQSAAGQMDLFSGDVKTKEQILDEVLLLLQNGTEQEQQEALDKAREQRKADAGREESVQQDGNAGESNQGERVSEPQQPEPTEEISDEEVESVISSMKEHAVTVPFVEITDNNWRNSVVTPIGEVKMGENQKEKLFAKGREQQYGMLLETLGNPDIILEELDKEENIFHERPSSYLFVKTFQKEDGTKYVHFESVTVSQEGMEISVSSHIIRENQLRNKVKSGRLLYKATALDEPAHPSAGQPTNEGVSLSSGGKGTEKSETTSGKSGNEETGSEMRGETEQTKPTDEAVAAANEEVDTNPTEAQKEAGNYKKGHVTIDGFDISIENPAGSTRSGTDAQGNPWSVTMHNSYGYIRMTEGVDGDHIDIFLSDHIDDWNGTVYVVDQVNADGSFDEHKVMYGFNSTEEAREAYLSNYSEGWQGLGTITSVSREEFKKWVDSSHRKTKAFADYKSVQTTEGQNEAAAPVSEDNNGTDGTNRTDNQAEETVTEQPKESREELDKRLNAERKQRILSEGTSFDKPFGLIAVSEDMSVEDIEANAQRIISVLKANRGNGKFKSFEGFVYGGSYGNNAGHQVYGYLYALNGVVKPSVIQAWFDGHGFNGLADIVRWGRKQYSKAASAQTEAEETETPSHISEAIGELGIDPGQVHVVSDASQLPKDEGAAYSAIRRGLLVEGWYNPKTGEVYLYAPNLKSKERAKKVVLHELVSHKGLRGLLGKDGFDGLCDEVWKSMESKDAERMVAYVLYGDSGANVPLDEYARAVADIGTRRKAADEYMAHLSEKGIEASAWERFRNAIVNALRRLGFDMRMTDADIRRLLRESYGALKAEGQVRTEEAPSGNADGTRFSITDVAGYDRENGTELQRFLDFVDRGKKLSDGEDRYFTVGKTGEMLNRYGMTGYITIGANAFNKRHSDDIDHNLTSADWNSVVATINDPIVITQYRGKEKSYRLYTKAMINGRYIAVGVDVNSVGRNVEVTNIKTAFGSDLEKVLNNGAENLLYPSMDELKKVVRQSSTAPNSRLYAGQPIDAAKLQNIFGTDGFDSKKNDSDVRFSISNANQQAFVSNAARAVEGIRQEKATPAQWLAMITKNGGLKAEEDKWMGLSDWLKEQKGSLTKQQVLDFINENKIQIEEVKYSEYGEQDEEIDPFNLESLESEVEEQKEINPTRLEYTTQGLGSKREIALVVPTIEPYNANDKIHFGDAGEGRAVAWVRFGDAVIPGNSHKDSKRAAEEYIARLTREKGLNDEYETMAQMTEDEIAELDAIEHPSSRGSDDQLVLVIDEIQSKRHQDGRENGYIDNSAKDELAAYIMYLNKKYGGEFKEDFGLRDVTKEEREKYYEIDNKVNDSGVPDAPFRKNWHELAMKRMLRYAAENGYDKVAWTTGEQQAERYDIGSVVQHIYAEPSTILEGGRDIDVIMQNGSGRDMHITTDASGIVIGSVDDNNTLIDGDYKGQHLHDIVGKSLADRLMTQDGVMSGNDLRIGADGMKAFYDKMLVDFMNKYGKKWGVKVGEVTLPNVEEAGRTMWGVDVNDAMKESVMEGQVMFSIVTPEMDAEYMEAVNNGDMDKAQRMVVDAAKKSGYDSSNGYQGSIAFNGAAPSKNGYFETSEERKEAFDNGDFEGEQSLGDYIKTGLDNWDLDWMLKNPIPASGRDSATLSSIRNISSAIRRENGKIKMYRAVDSNIKENSFRNGDWITPSREYAERHIGLQDWEEGRIIEQEVSVDDIWWDGNDINEWGYDDGIGYGYRNTENNRKLLDPITYDDNGNVIPLSQRFDNRNADVRFSIADAEGEMQRIRREAQASGLTDADEADADGMPYHRDNEISSLRDEKQVAFDAVMNALGNAGIEVVEATEEDVEKLKASIRSIEDSKGTFRGWVGSDGKIHLTKDGMNAETPIHEYTHLWAEALQMNNPELWEQIKGLLKGTPEWEKIVGSKGYRHIRNDEDRIAGEVLAHISGKKNAARMEEEAGKMIAEAPTMIEAAKAASLLGRMREALKKFWTWVGKTLLGRKGSINIDQVSNMVMADLANGVNPFNPGGRKRKGTSASVDEDTDIESVNRKFNDELDSLTTDNADSKVLDCGMPSAILMSVGVPAKKLRLYGNKVIKKARKHGFSITDIKDLPLSLQRPIAVFNGNHEDSFAVLTEMKINDLNTLVSIETNKEGEIDFNVISSVYGKNEKSVIGWINDGNLLYADKEKALGYISDSAPIAEAQYNQGPLSESVKKNLDFASPSAPIADATQNQDFISAAKVIENFVNPQVEGENFSDADLSIDEGTDETDRTDVPEMSDEEAEQYDAGRMTFTEIATEGVIKAAEKNKEDLRMRNEAVKAIGVSLNRLRQAMAKQKEYDKATVDSIVRLARMMIENGYMDNMSRSEVKRLMTLAKNATGKTDITKQANAVVDLMLKHQLKAAEAVQQKLLSTKGSKVNASGVEVQAGLDITGQRTVKAMKEGIELDEAALAERIADVNDRMGGTDKTLAANAAEEYEGLMMAKDYHDMIRQSEQDEAQLRHELDQAKEDVKNGTLGRKDYKELAARIDAALRKNMAERVMAFTRLNQQLAEVINGSKGRAREFREKQMERVREIQHNANSDMKGTSASEHKKAARINKVVNSGIVRFFFNPVATFDEMLRFFGKKSVDGMGYLWQRFMGGYIDAADTEWRSLKKDHDALDEKVSEVMGEKMRWSDLFSMERRMKPIEVEFYDTTTNEDGEAVRVKEKHPLTQGNALYIYMVNKMDDGAMKLRRMGITDEDVDSIAGQLDPRFLQLADWIQDEFLPKKREAFNAVHMRMFGAPMAAIEEYFPLVTNSRSRGKDEDISEHDKGETKPSTITGSIIKRTVNTTPLDVTNADAFDVLLGHLRDMEHWAAFAELNRDMNTLLSYKRFKNQVLNTSSVRFGAGETLWNNFKDVCAIAADVYHPKVNAQSLDNAIVNISKGVTSAKISFRLYTALKQLLSYPAYFSEANPIELAKSTGRPAASFNWALDNLPGFAERWQSRQAGDSRLKDTDADWDFWKNKFVDTARRWGMTPNAFVDGITVAMGAKAIYESKMKGYLKAGYSETEAKEKALKEASAAVNETQQSSQNAYLSAMQLDRTVASVALTVFRNASMGYERRLLRAVDNIKRKFTKGYKEESIEFMRKKMVREGLTEEQAKAASERAWNISIAKDVANVVIFGFVMQLAWNLGSSLIYLIFGDDDDEKERMWEDAALHALAGPVEGLSGGSVISEVYNMARSGKKISNYNFQLLPIMSDLQTTMRHMEQDKVRGIQDIVNIVIQIGVGVNPQTITDAAVAIVDAADGDLGLGKEIGLCALRIMQVPQSQLDQLYIDELGMSAKDAKALPMEELAQRYAAYKRMKDAPLTGWAYSDEAREKVDKRYVNKFVKLVQERVANMDDEALERNMDDNDDLMLKKQVGKEVASRLEGKDTYGNQPQSNWKEETKKAHLAYQQLRGYVDLCEDVVLQKAQADADKAYEAALEEGKWTEAQTQQMRAKGIEQAREQLNKMRRQLGQGNGQYDQQIMENIRAMRSLYMEYYGLKGKKE